MTKRIHIDGLKLKTDGDVENFLEELDLLLAKYCTDSYDWSYAVKADGYDPDPSN